MPDTVGQQLQQARTARGIDLDEAAQATCIRVWYLRALETDDRASLPSGVQGKGFLRNYAAYLGLPVQDLLDQWDGKAPKIPEVVVASEPAVTQPVEDLPPAPELEPDFEAAYSAPEINLEYVPGAETQPIAPADPTADASLPASPPLSASQAIFNEIGRTLQEQRELLSLSLPEVERYTHLRIHYLKAMEAGRMDDLPSMVQGRGMLSNYATFLNLDANTLLNRFADALQARREELNAVVEPTPGKRRAPVQPPAHPVLKRLLSMDLLVGGGLIILLVTFVIWAASQVMDARNQALAEQQTVPAVAVINGTFEPTGETEGTPAPEVAAVASTNDAIATDPALAGPTAEIAQSGTEPAGTAQAGGPPQAIEGKVQVYIVPRYRAWMRVTVDGKIEFTGRTVPGSPYAYTGDQSIELLTGNGAALQVYYNETDLGTLGDWSEVVDRIFTVDQGMIQPTPTVTPTPTRTPDVSPTPTSTPTTRPGLPYQPTIP